MSATRPNLLPFHRSSDVTGGEDWSESSDDATLPTDAGRADTQTWQDTNLRIDRLQHELLELKAQSVRAGNREVVTIDTLAPDLADLVRPFHANVEPYEDGFKASYLDGNLMAFGETPSEAVWNLKDLIAATYEALTEIDEERLGPGPARQLAVLRQFIRE